MRSNIPLVWRRPTQDEDEQIGVYAGLLSHTPLASMRHADFGRSKSSKA